MVAKNKKTSKKQQQQRAQASKRPRVPRGMRLASSADTYADLLADPCRGPLVGPIGATQKGYITRFEKTIVVPATYVDGTTKNTTCFAIRWNPGVIDPSATAQDTLQGRVEVASNATLSTAAFLTNDESPGYTFINTTATSARCLAACMQVTYTGSELNRQGVVGSFVSSASLAFSSTNAETLMGITQSRSRVADGMFEVRWKPNDYDVNFSHFNQSASTEQMAKHSALYLVGQNLSPTTSANTAIMVRLVAVYEWTPDANEGMIVPAAPPGSAETLASAVRRAYEKGAAFGELVHAAHGTYQRVRNAIAGVGAYAYGAGRSVAPLLLTM